jgi:hypothetical protein
MLGASPEWGVGREAHGFSSADEDPEPPAHPRLTACPTEPLPASDSFLWSGDLSQLAVCTALPEHRRYGQRRHEPWESRTRASSAWFLRIGQAADAVGEQVDLSGRKRKGSLPAMGSPTTCRAGAMSRARRSGGKPCSTCPRRWPPAKKPWCRGRPGTRRRTSRSGRAPGR